MAYQGVWAAEPSISNESRDLDQSKNTRIYSGAGRLNIISAVQGTRAELKWTIDLADFDLSSVVYKVRIKDSAQGDTEVVYPPFYKETTVSLESGKFCTVIIEALLKGEILTYGKIELKSTDVPKIGGNFDEREFVQDLYGEIDKRFDKYFLKTLDAPANQNLPPTVIHGQRVPYNGPLDRVVTQQVPHNVSQQFNSTHYQETLQGQPQPLQNLKNPVVPPYREEPPKKLETRKNDVSKNKEMQESALSGGYSASAPNNNDNFNSAPGGPNKRKRRRRKRKIQHSSSEDESAPIMVNNNINNANPGPNNKNSDLWPNNSFYSDSTPNKNLASAAKKPNNSNKKIRSLLDDMNWQPATENQGFLASSASALFPVPPPAAGRSQKVNVNDEQRYQTSENMPKGRKEVTPPTSGPQPPPPQPIGGLGADPNSLTNNLLPPPPPPPPLMAMGWPQQQPTTAASNQQQQPIGGGQGGNWTNSVAAGSYPSSPWQQLQAMPKHEQLQLTPAAYPSSANQNWPRHQFQQEFPYWLQQQQQQQTNFDWSAQQTPPQFHWAPPPRQQQQAPTYQQQQAPPPPTRGPPLANQQRPNAAPPLAANAAAPSRNPHSNTNDYESRQMSEVIDRIEASRQRIISAARAGMDHHPSFQRASYSDSAPNNYSDPAPNDPVDMEIEAIEI